MKRLGKWMNIGLLIGMLAFACWASMQPASAQATRRRVLYINSYHRGYKFSDDITRGIEETFKKANVEVELVVEYMDTKRLDSLEYMDELYRLYQIKYGTNPPDLVMSSDDAALNFLFQYANDLFPGIPVVFCGANYFDTRRLVGFERFTGVSELVDVKGTLDLALKIHPQTKRVVFVNDVTITGQRVHEQIAALKPLYPDLEFVYLENVSMTELQQQLGQLEPGALVLLTLFFRDRLGNFYEYDTFTSLVAQSSAVPVYGTWDFSLGYGIVGGQLTSGLTEGERAAQIAVRILNGERPQDIPVVQEPATRPMFDYVQLKRWGISESALPDKSIIINKPFSFFETYRELVWSVGVSLAVLSIAVAILSVNVVRRQKAEMVLRERNRELDDARALLEQRVQERTAAYLQRVALLQAAAEVSRALTDISDLDILLPRVVELVRERFDLYYVGLFLLDEERRWAVLHAGTGEPGRQMLARGWRLEVGGRSMIGRCVATGRADIQLDVGEAAVRFDNPFLPLTRSEMALPLRTRGEVIGAMTIQSARPSAFSEDDIRTIQMMADQIASAITNLRLLQQIQESLEAERQRYAARAGEAWRVLAQTEAIGYVGDRRRIVPAGDLWRSEMRKAVRSRQMVVSEQGDAVAIPLLMRGQVVGVVDGRKPDGQPWNEDELDLLQAMIEQLKVALEGARLYRESQLRAAREQIVSEISGRIRETLNLDLILRTAAEQMRQKLALEGVIVRLVRPETLNSMNGDTVKEEGGRV